MRGGWRVDGVLETVTGRLRGALTKRRRRREPPVPRRPPALPARAVRRRRRPAWRRRASGASSRIRTPARPRTAPSTAFWPPVGVGIAALVLYGPRLWPGVAIGASLAGDYSTPFGLVLGQTAGTVVARRGLPRCSCGSARAARACASRDVTTLILCAAAGDGARRGRRDARDLARGRSAGGQRAADLAHLVAVRPGRGAWSSRPRCCRGGRRACA